MGSIVIGLTGKARAGKDTVARMLVHNFGLSRLSFAESLKEAAYKVFGFDPDLDGPDKEQVDPYWKMSPRQIWQDFGQCLKGQFGAGLWIRSLQHQYGHLLAVRPCVITDVRFDFEASWIRDELGGVIWQITRPDTSPVRDHVSERGVSPHLIDVSICNDGTLDDLRSQVCSLYLNFPRPRKVEAIK